MFQSTLTWVLSRHRSSGFKDCLFRSLCFLSFIFYMLLKQFLFQVNILQGLSFLIFIYLFVCLFFGYTRSLLLFSHFLYLWWVGAALLLQHVGFSSQRLLLFQSTEASVVAAYGLSSCGTWALLPLMWNLPRPGSNPVSPALAGRFLTIGPPG